MNTIIFANQYIIQYTSKYLQPDILYKIGTLLNIHNPHILCYYDSTFYAPYINFYTTFSTTFIQILEKLSYIDVGCIKRFEPIYLAYEKVDTQIYRLYNTLSQYHLECIKNNYTDIFHIPNYIKYLELQQLGFDNDNRLQDKSKYTYFDIMSWIQCNSEHSRHWVFRTPLIINNHKTNLLQMIKDTLTSTNNFNSIVAFSDNSSVIKGLQDNILLRKNMFTSKYETIKTNIHPALTAETHNYPTYYHPFEGAATGVGGRIRDNLAIGCGSMSHGSLIGYSFNNSELLIKASNGASDYANKVGEPCLGGYVRYNIYFEKPILFTAGIGYIKQSHLFNEIRDNIKPGDYIIKIGPDAFKIGFGGSIQSSVNNNADDTDMTAIQRGDPYNGNKIIRFLELLSYLDKPLIKKIHDQGAGGLGNVVTELISPYDCIINIAQLPSADGMNTLECWLSEYQEQMVFICHPDNYNILLNIAKSEGVKVYKLGEICLSQNSQITFICKEQNINGIYQEYLFNYNKLNELKELDKYSKILQDININNYEIMVNNDFEYTDSEYEKSFKFYLTNKIDRSVSGCVVQQPCVGPFGIPMSNYSIIRASPLSKGGCITAIGENIDQGQSIDFFIKKCVSELLANLMGVPNQLLHEIKCSANWMHFSQSYKHVTHLLQSVIKLREILLMLDIGIDGGKDSLSMSMNKNNNLIISPPTLVLSSYCWINESSIEKRVTPLLQNTIHTQLYGIDLLEHFDNIKDIYYFIQKHINQQLIYSLHDGSNYKDIIEEMCVVSGYGIVCNQNVTDVYNSLLNHKIVIQINSSIVSSCLLLGFKRLAIINFYNTNVYYDFNMNSISLETIFHDRNKLSLHLDTSKIKYQVNYTKINYKWSNNYDNIYKARYDFYKNKKIAIIRDEGSNSHREMASAFLQFDSIDVIDFTINDLLQDKAKLELFEVCNGYCFVGGFSYGDVLGSGLATANIMKTRLNHVFTKIFNDSSKFVIGICNGCQILINYGLFDNDISITHNDSGKFESRWLPVKINNEQILGIWNAHGEGKLIIPNTQQHLVFGEYISNEYPLNPNGSSFNAFGLCSNKFKHIVMMPHPERSLFKWQCEYIPEELEKRDKSQFTPWILFYIGLLDDTIKTGLDVKNFISS
jgi:phosphoribosylformylglycinamidine synthase